MSITFTICSCQLSYVLSQQDYQYDIPTFQADSIIRPQLTVIDHLNEDDGLPHFDVTCILQDYIGYIWCGTRNGLARYDGYEFKVYNNSPIDSTSLSSNIINTLYEDGSNNLWIGTTRGLNLLDRKTGSFISYQHVDNDSTSLVFNDVKQIYEDKHGNLWIGTYRGLSLFDRNSGEFNNFFANGLRKYNLGRATVTSFGEDLQGGLWVGIYGAGIGQYDSLTSSFQFNGITNDKRFSGSKYVNGIINYDSLFLLFSEPGLFVFNPHSKKYLSLSFQNFKKGPRLQPNIFASAFVDMEQQLWCGWVGGFSKYNPQTNQFTPISGHRDINIPKTIIIDIIQDKEGLIWCASIGKGIFVINPYKECQVDLLDLSMSNNGDARGKAIPICQAPGQDKLWIKTENFLVQTSSDGTTFRAFDQTALNGFHTSLIYAGLQDRRGRLWLGFTNFGWSLLQPEAQSFRHVGSQNTNGLRYINQFWEDSDGDIWACTWEGLYKFNESTQLFSKWKWSNPAPRIIRTSQMTEDYNKTLWMGTVSGQLYKFNKADNELTSIDRANIDADINYDEDLITCLHPNGNRELFIGSYGSGVYIQDLTDGTSRHLTTDDGLLDNLVTNIFQDSVGFTWIVTPSGLSRFTGDTIDKFVTYVDGLPDRFIDRSVYNTSTHRVIAGSEQGAASISLTKTCSSGLQPTVHISEVSYNGERINVKDPLSSGSAKVRNGIKINHNHEILKVSFSALSFSKPSRNQYAYKLMPVNENWVQIMGKNELVFTRLSPGNYNLMITGSNGDNVWSPSGTNLNIRVLPPWYWSPFSKLLYALIGITAIYFLTRFIWQRRMEHIETIQLKKLDAAKTRLYTNITHEFRTPITVIRGMVEEIRNAPAEWFSRGLDMIDRNASTLLTLVNQMLDLRKLESGSLPVNMIQDDIIVYLKYLVESVHSYAVTKDIEISFESDRQELIMDFDPEKTHTIICNILTNAIKFNHSGGEVLIQVTTTIEPNGLVSTISDQYLDVTIKNTGPGIDKDHIEHIFDRFYQVDAESTRHAEGSGIGLALTKELIELIEGKIKVESTPGQWTTFQLLFPIQHKAPRPKEIPVNSVSDGRVATNTLTDITYTKDIQRVDRPTALLVEDNADVLVYIQTCLSEDYNISLARNGVNGVRMAIDLIPDIVISDVMMPNMNGFQLCAKLKKDSRTSHIPIILLTAKADLDSRLEGLATGADAYLSKPFNREELRIRVAKLLALRKQLQQYYADGDSANTAVTDFSQQTEFEFVHQIRNHIRDNISNHQLTVDQLSQKIHMSRYQLNRKLKALTGLSPNQLIRKIRLERSQELLLTSIETVSTIAYDVGFSDPAYFSRVFKNDIGMSPSAFRELHGQTGSVHSG